MKVIHLMIGGLVLTAVLCLEREPARAQASSAVQTSTLVADAPPTALLDIGDEATQVFDAARLSNWNAAAIALSAMDESAADVPANFSEPDLAARLHSRLQEVGDAVATRERLQTMDLANRITLLVANLSEDFQTPLPYALLLLNFYGRELQLGIAGADQARLTRASADLKQTWNQFERKVLEQGAVDEARRFTDVVAQLDGAQVPADFVDPARAELEAVDRLKKIFKP
jgi:signal transduction histidine kinase